MINFGYMVKRWCSIKEIEACLLCKTLISKYTLQGQKYCCKPPYAVAQKSKVFFFFHSSGPEDPIFKCLLEALTSVSSYSE